MTSAAKTTAAATATAGGEGHEAQAARDRALRHLLAPDELAWQANEQYDAVSNTWRVDMLRIGTGGGWMCNRYKYDVARGVVYFFGQRPVDDAEVAALRKTAKIVRR